MRFAAICVSLAVLAAGCGQRGALYLRDEPPPGVKAERPAVEKMPGERSPDGAGDEAQR